MCIEDIKAKLRPKCVSAVVRALRDFLRDPTLNSYFDVNLVTKIDHYNHTLYIATPYKIYFTPVCGFAGHRSACGCYCWYSTNDSPRFGNPGSQSPNYSMSDMYRRSGLKKRSNIIAKISNCLRYACLCVSRIKIILKTHSHVIVYAADRIKRVSQEIGINLQNTHIHPL